MRVCLITPVPTRADLEEDGFKHAADWYDFMLSSDNTENWAEFVSESSPADIGSDNLQDVLAKMNALDPQGEALSVRVAHLMSHVHRALTRRDNRPDSNRDDFANEVSRFGKTQGRQAKSI